MHAANEFCQGVEMPRIGNQERRMPMTYGQENSTEYVARLVSRWIDVSASCLPLWLVL